MFESVLLTETQTVLVFSGSAASLFCQKNWLKFLVLRGSDLYLCGVLS